MQHISSVIPGRFRLRNPMLKDQVFGKKMRENLKSAHGVLEVKLNQLVGSILVIYDTAKTRGKDILKRVSEEIGVDCRKWLKKGSRILADRRAKRLVKLGMIAGIGGTVGALAVSKKMHVVAGSLLLGTMVIHGIQNRRTLLK